MYEADKLDEAEYFLTQMASAVENREAHRYNLSAFLSAARSVLQFACKEAQAKQGGQAWYDNQVSANRVVGFFKGKRNLSIHFTPINPVMGIQVGIKDSLHFSDSLEAVIVHDGTPTESRTLKQQNSPLPAGTAWPYPSKVTISKAYRFDDWTGPEDLPTLCAIYLASLRNIVAAGQSKGYLTP